MNRDRLVMVLAAVFGGLAVTVALLGVVVEPLLLVIAVPFGVVSYFMWYQASGRLGRYVYRRVEEAGRVDRDPGRGGFGAGPRPDWDPRSEWVSEGRVGGPTGGRANGRRAGNGRQAPRTTDGPTEREAYALLGVEPGADVSTIRRAYRERVKEVHPDTKTGDEETFKRVNAAYERLTD